LNSCRSNENYDDDDYDEVEEEEEIIPKRGNFRKILVDKLLHTLSVSLVGNW